MKKQIFFYYQTHFQCHLDEVKEVEDAFANARKSLETSDKEISSQKKSQKLAQFFGTDERSLTLPTKVSTAIFEGIERNVVQHFDTKKKGLLLKLGNNIVKGWKPRWFVLYPSHIWYYKYKTV